MDRGVGRVREEMADARLMAASFCASDASFCISEVFSEASSTLDVGGAAQLSDVVRRGGSGACRRLALVVDAEAPPSADLNGHVDVTARRSSAPVEYRRQPNGLNDDRPAGRRPARGVMTSQVAGALGVTSAFSVLSEEQFLSVTESSWLGARLQHKCHVRLYYDN